MSQKLLSLVNEKAQSLHSDSQNIINKWAVGCCAVDRKHKPQGNDEV